MSLAVDVRHGVGSFSLAVDFRVPGDLAVLFGPSGAGKSLTLRIIAGLERPAAGRVELGGEVLADTATGVHVPPQQRRIGMVFQQPLLLPHRTALRNVGLAARGTSRSERRRVAAGWLARVGAAELAHRKPAQLSGGQQQRVALARALAGDPQLLLLDEPFSALDQPVRRRLRQLVRELVHAEQVPAVFVTHDREELAVLADRVVLADPGSITRVVDPSEVAAIVGDPPAGDERIG